jgi:hypothetical protein
MQATSKDPRGEQRRSKIANDRTWKHLCCARASTIFGRDLDRNATQIRQRGGFILAWNRNPARIQPCDVLLCVQQLSRRHNLDPELDSGERPKMPRLSQASTD